MQDAGEGEEEGEKGKDVKLIDVGRKENSR